VQNYRLAATFERSYLIQMMLSPRIGDMAIDR
jgi:hypothetical protein